MPFPYCLRTAFAYDCPVMASNEVLTAVSDISHPIAHTGTSANTRSMHLKTVNAPTGLSRGIWHYLTMASEASAGAKRSMEQVGAWRITQMPASGACPL